MADEVARIEGLTEFRAELRAADKALPKALTDAHRTIARMVVAKAAPKLVSKHGHAQGGVKIAALASQSGATIRLSGPAAFGAEFGGGKFRPGHPTPAGGHTTQFRPWRGRDGYAVFPTLRSERDEIRRIYWGTVEEAVVRRAFPQ